MAYEVLSNPDKRRLYDQAGEQGIKEGGSGGGGFGGSNPMDIFDMFFGGGDPFGRGGRSRGPRRTKTWCISCQCPLKTCTTGLSENL